MPAFDLQPVVRMRRTAATRVAILVLLAGIGACSALDEALPEDADDGFVVDDGKADDYFSLKAKEFVVTSTGRITAEEGASPARVKKLIGLEHTAITWFLNQYLVD